MAANHAAVVSILGSTPIATGAYSQLVAATPYACTTFVIANGTDANITLAVGAAGSEVDFVCVAAGQQQKVIIGLNQIPVGSRLAVIAALAASTKGVYSVSLLQ